MFIKPLRLVLTQYFNDISLILAFFMNNFKINLTFDCCNLKISNIFIDYIFFQFSDNDRDTLFFRIYNFGGGDIVFSNT